MTRIIIPGRREIEDVLKKQERVTNYTAVKLPCGHSSVQITKPEDQFLYCPECGKKFLLMWSKVKPKIQWQK